MYPVIGHCAVTSTAGTLHGDAEVVNDDDAQSDPLRRTSRLRTNRNVTRDRRKRSRSPELPTLSSGKRTWSIERRPPLPSRSKLGRPPRGCGVGLVDVHASGGVNEVVVLRES